MAGRAIKIDPKKSDRKTTTTVPETSVEQDITSLDPNEIAIRSYELWLDRGCPIGSPETDWFSAEEELRKR